MQFPRAQQVSHLVLLARQTASTLLRPYLHSFYSNYGDRPLRQAWDDGCLMQQQQNASTLVQHLCTKIMVRGGPISIAEYMQDCLTSPVGGFYMDKDVFGRRGHFTTSPEISQLFGEMVGIWCVHTWMQLGQPSRLHLVELGPGRGTLISDLLRGTSVFKPFAASLDVHLVEVSPALRRMQWAALRCRETDHAHDVRSITLPNQLVGQQQQQQQHQKEEAAPPVEGISGWTSSKVTWHPTLDSVPQDAPTLLIAHEFIDALPVHQFVRDPQRGWLEKMVDVDTDTDDGAHNDNADVVTHAGSNGAGVHAERGQATAHNHHHHHHHHHACQGTTAASSSQATHTGGKSSDSGEDKRGGSSSSSSSSAGSSNAVLGSSPAGAGVSGEATEGGSPAGPRLRMVLAPSATPASALLVPRRLAGLSPQEAEGLKELEVCAQGMALAERLAQRLGRTGGAALVVDYGRDSPPYGDSLIAIRDHKGVDVLDGPGTADLSAWVDFGALRLAVEGANAPATTTGPVSQATFLRAMGIEARLERLMAAATSVQEAEHLKSGVDRLVDDGSSGRASSTPSSSSPHSGGCGEGMGHTYQVMAIHHKDLEGKLAGFA